jgi:serine/threonine protein kinase
MQVDCPHCQNSFDSAQNVEGEILCSACGSSFGLDPDRTRTAVVDRRQLGKFELIPQVGTGAFGDVWRARDTELDPTVAIKIPHGGLLAGEKETQRFVREPRSAAQLCHPGIVAVYEVGRHEIPPYLVADFTEGTTLANYLESHSIEVRVAAEWAGRLMASIV